MNSTSNTLTVSKTFQSVLPVLAYHSNIFTMHRLVALLSLVMLCQAALPSHGKHSIEIRKI
jgi:hypothetical protein